MDYGSFATLLQRAETAIPFIIIGVDLGVSVKGGGFFYQYKVSI
jgi:hypothetical protein